MTVDHKIELPAAKRIFDILVSLTVIVVMSPIWPVIMVLIFVEHILIGRQFVGLFYTEERYSYGRPFKMVKFNIFNPGILNQMKSQGRFIHTKDIEHIAGGLTKIGTLLKNVYLDEFPQFLNVLKGEISVVGPRPLNREVYEDHLARGNFTRKYLKAGLTGNFQVMKGDPNAQAGELDNYYMEYCATQPAWKIVWFDIRICIRTILFMLKAEGI